MLNWFKRLVNFYASIRKNLNLYKNLLCKNFTNNIYLDEPYHFTQIEMVITSGYIAILLLLEDNEL